MVIGLFLFAIAAILIGALLVRLAVHALPVCCAFLASQAVHASGAGLVAVIAAGALAAIATLALGQILLALAKSPLARIAVGLAFALPAGAAGYFAMRGIADVAMPASIWQQMLPIIVAIAIAAASWTRLGSAPPERR
ncbi:MAG: hypothetical protein C0429_09375 [Sphingopyxis sp.]|jgi:hypothetical protein|nr:hypothetical protein [Sphingopyxis sp.]